MLFTFYFHTLYLLNSWKDQGQGQTPGELRPSGVCYPVSASSSLGWIHYREGNFEYLSWLFFLNLYLAFQIFFGNLNCCLLLILILYFSRAGGIFRCLGLAFNLEEYFIRGRHFEQVYFKYNFGNFLSLFLKNNHGLLLYAFSKGWTETGKDHLREDRA